MTLTTREEHLSWCKRRALEYVDSGDLDGALGSMISDMRKHPKTADHVAIKLGFMLKMNGHLNSAEEMRKFIEDFN